MSQLLAEPLSDTPSSSQSNESPAAPAAAFASVLCASDNSPAGRVARLYAKQLAAPQRDIQTVPTAAVTRCAPQDLRQLCAGHDVLVVAGRDEAACILRHCPIPVLLARGRPRRKLTDRILLAVDDSLESRRATTLAARLAAEHGGAIRLIVLERRNPARQRALASAARLILDATGTPARVLRPWVPPQRAIPSVATGIDATLVIVGIGRREPDDIPLEIARRVGCSVLAVPA